MDTTTGYWTHQAPLINAVLHTEGVILELGSGDYSTPLLHELCRPTKRRLITCDSEESWLTYYLPLVTDWHDLILVKDWDDINGHFGLVFIDHVTERRVVDLRRLKSFTDVFVVHDSEKQRWYKYGDSFSTFKFRYDYTLYTKRTTLLSDKINVANFFC